MLIGGGLSLAGDKVRVGGRPSPVMERRSTRAPVLAVLQPNTSVEVLDREDGWCWVLVQADSAAGSARAGWIRKEALVPDVPSGVSNPPAAARIVTAEPARVLDGGSVGASIDDAGPPAVSRRGSVG